MVESGEGVVDGVISWSKIAKACGVHKERVRSLWRRHTSVPSVIDPIRYNGVTKKVEEYQKVLKTLRVERTLESLGRLLKRSQKEVLVLMEELKDNGYQVVSRVSGGSVCFLYIPKPEVVEEEYYCAHTGESFTLALVSDTHKGSNFFAKEALDKFYRYAYSKGVRDFYHAGDVTDGFYKSRDTNWFEQYAHGFSEQLNDCISNYPRLDGVTTYFITGNHDLTHTFNGGANLGWELGGREDRARKDMVYLGHNFAKVWLTPKVDLNLVHPTDGGAWAVTHKIQKIIDSAEGVRKSKILAVGHYHKMAWIEWKGTHGFVMPSFQNQTPFMRDNNLASYVGGIILTIKVDSNGDLISVTPEHVGF